MGVDSQTLRIRHTYFPQGPFLDRQLHKCGHGDDAATWNWDPQTQAFLVPNHHST